MTRVERDRVRGRLIADGFAGSRASHQPSVEKSAR